MAEAVDSASSSSADEAAEDGRHEQMLAEITQQRTAGRQKQRRPLMTEAYPESEANLPPVQGDLLPVSTFAFHLVLSQLHLPVETGSSWLAHILGGCLKQSHPSPAHLVLHPSLLQACVSLDLNTTIIELTPP